MTGEPRPLPAGLEVCVYRVVQEGLTNVVKHAGGAAARVGLRYGRGELVVTIVDDGRAAHPAGGTSGKGLIGMRERAMLYGGTLDAGREASGGFRVRLTLPIGAAP